MSSADILLGCVNLTKAPPSFKRGMISVTWIGTALGIACLARPMGSRRPREYVSSCFSTSEKSRLVNRGRQSINGVSFKGKRSVSNVRPRAHGVGLMGRNTIEEQNGLIWASRYMTSLVGLLDWGRLIIFLGGALFGLLGSCLPSAQQRPVVTGCQWTAHSSRSCRPGR